MTPDQLQFEQARKLFPGTKLGFEEEWEYLKYSTKKRKRNMSKIIPLFLPAIKEQIRRRDILKEVNKFVPPWKMFQTWINKGCWTEEIALPDGYKPRPKAKWTPRPKPERVVELSDEQKLEMRKTLPPAIRKALETREQLGEHYDKG